MRRVWGRFRPAPRPKETLASRQHGVRSSRASNTSPGHNRIDAGCCTGVTRACRRSPSSSGEICDLRRQPPYRPQYDPVWRALRFEPLGRLEGHRDCPSRRSTAYAAPESQIHLPNVLESMRGVVGVFREPADLVRAAPASPGLPGSRPSADANAWNAVTHASPATCARYFIK